MQQTMLQVKRLTKRFGGLVALHQVNLHIATSEILGIIGPNGAGKSTAMKMLACFISPDRGTATVCGYDILKNPIKVRESLGYLAENAPACGEMTVGSFLNFICDARRIQGKARKERIDHITGLCAIESVYHQSIETLSKGYRRRVGLAQTLIPGSPVIMEFIQYENHNKGTPHPHFQDPGAAHILFMVKDVDVIMPRVRAAGVQPLSGSGGPTFIGPQTRAFFITGPDGYWAEFMDHGVKSKPK